MNPFYEIKKNKFLKVGNGQAENIPDFFEKIIKNQFNNVDTIKEIHQSLLEYIDIDDPFFFIRLYGSYSKNNYQLLRRGFLSEYIDGKKVAFCDNTFTLLFAGMKLADLPYSSFDLRNLLSQKNLIVGFGQVSNEKELCYYTPKKALRANLNYAGWYQAHIKPTGYGYETFKLRELFPNPPRREFENQIKIRPVDRILNLDQLKVIKAQFLRLIHPFNSFLVPKRNQLNYSGNNIGEENELINFVRSKIEQMFPNEYQEFDELSIKYEIAKQNSKLYGIEWFDKPRTISKRTSKQTNNSDMGLLLEKKAVRSESTENETEINLENSLRAIGKKVFATILYPELIENIYISYQEIAAKHTKYSEFTINSQGSRLSKAKSIFRNGLETEALLNVLYSQNVGEDVKKIISKYLKNK